ncbi:glycoside hydrolase family 88 protein [Aeromonas enteropelogenes]|uniref:glycoside hydrolase family 88 protein n=1 Tax=Aeromonas enteropelogenes TaxID=29489 RepID=UPI003F748A0F
MIKNSIYHLEHLPPISNEEVVDELRWTCQKLKKLIDKVGTEFPSACAVDNKYLLKKNNDWTNGFWTGMLLIAYEFTGDTFFKDKLDGLLDDFIERLDQHIVLDHHDIGFLYSLSLVAARQVFDTDKFDAAITLAADKLVDRYHEDSQFIQAWGNMSDDKEYRLIIDSLINLPLLYKAHEISGNEKYSDVALNHFGKVAGNIFREDYSSYHTYYFDRASKLPLKGETFQGYSDSSCWARGQAWAVLGLPLTYRYHPELIDNDKYMAICDYFLSRLPEDGVPFWDLHFKAEDNQPKDSSALAITVCGLLEAGSLLKDDDFHTLSRKLLKSLRDNMTSREDAECDGLLKHGVYAFSLGKGIDECNLWGDYYYMESLYRVHAGQWQTYW